MLHKGTVSALGRPPPRPPFWKLCSREQSWTPRGSPGGAGKDPGSCVELGRGEGGGPEGGRAHAPGLTASPPPAPAGSPGRLATVRPSVISGVTYRSLTLGLGLDLHFMGPDTA